MSEDKPGRFGGEQHGWSPDVDDDTPDAEEATRKAMGTPPPEKGEGREVSSEERSGVSDTDIEPGSPFGSGKSTTRSGEDVAGEDDGTEGYKGKSQRPYGKGRVEDSSGVDPKNPIDPESPKMPSGDQGG